MNGFPKKMLLATDGTEEAVARAAVDLASRSGAELHVVHAWHDVPSARLGRFVRRELRAVGGEALDGQVRRLDRLGASVSGAHLVEGRTVEAVAQTAGELGADLILAGSHGRGGFGRLLAGSIHEGVVHHARVPVLVVPNGGAWPPGRVVVGDDGSREARKAGDLAAHLARLVGAEVEIVRAYPSLLTETLAGHAPTAHEVDEALRHEEDDLGGRARELEAVLGRRPRVRRFAGDAPDSILKATGGRGALVAVGARGLGAVGRMRLGSVSDKIMRSAPGPVLVAPHLPETAEGVAKEAPVEETRYAKILVATDGSARARRAGEHAVYLAKNLGARIYALYVVDVERAFRTGAHYAAFARELDLCGREAVGEISTLAAGSGVEHEELVVEGRGSVARTVVRVAEELEADCVVLGSVRVSGLERAFAGSVSEGVMRHAKVPVLLVGDEREVRGAPPRLGHALEVSERGAEAGRR